jgi:hypothetical protein
VTTSTFDLGRDLVSDAERARLVEIVPDPLVRAEVLFFLQETRMHAALDEMLFLGTVVPTVIDGELKFDLSPSRRSELERRLLRGGASASSSTEARR